MYLKNGLAERERGGWEGGREEEGQPQVRWGKGKRTGRNPLVSPSLSIPAA